MSRYIDADEAEKWLRAGCAYAIRELPSIDIVRCAECKRRKKNGFCLEHNRYEKNDNGYCSYGERLE